MAKKGGSPRCRNRLLMVHTAAFTHDCQQLLTLPRVGPRLKGLKDGILPSPAVAAASPSPKHCIAWVSPAGASVLQSLCARCYHAAWLFVPSVAHNNNSSSDSTSALQSTCCRGFTPAAKRQLSTYRHMQPHCLTSYSQCLGTFTSTPRPQVRGVWQGHRQRGSEHVGPL